MLDTKKYDRVHHSMLGRGSSCMIDAALQGGPTVRGSAEKPRLLWSWPSALLRLMSLIFLVTIDHRSSLGVRGTSRVLNLIFWQRGQVPGPAAKWKQHVRQAAQQEEEPRAGKISWLTPALTLPLITRSTCWCDSLKSPSFVSSVKRRSSRNFANLRFGEIQLRLLWCAFTSGVLLGHLSLSPL